MSNTVYDLTSEDFADFALDQMDERERTPARFTFEGNEFEGMVLGFGSSFSDDATHTGHMPGSPPKRGNKCSACRWADVAVFRARVGNSDTPMYAVISMGKSLIEGEETRIKQSWTEEALAVLEALYTNAKPVRNGDDGEDTEPPVTHAGRRIPVVNAIAFRYAAFVDAGIRTVLEEWDDAVPDYKRKESTPRY